MRACAGSKVYGAASRRQRERGAATYPRRLLGGGASWGERRFPVLRTWSRSDMEEPTPQRRPIIGVMGASEPGPGALEAAYRLGEIVAGGGGVMPHRRWPAAAGGSGRARW